MLVELSTQTLGAPRSTKTEDVFNMLSNNRFQSANKIAYVLGCDVIEFDSILII